VDKLIHCEGIVKFAAVVAMQVGKGVWLRSQQARCAIVVQIGTFSLETICLVMEPRAVVAQATIILRTWRRVRPDATSMRIQCHLVARAAWLREIRDLC
jgi:hypothetical protein